MKFLSYIIPLALTVFGALIPINALNSKTIFGKTFLTDEQKIKVKYFNTILLAFIIATAVAYFTFAIKVNATNEFQVTSKDISSSLVWGIAIFIIFLMITSPVVKWIDNFFIKDHIKYKVTQIEQIGDVYIIRMHDKDTCICSKDPNAEFLQDSEYILIAMQEIYEKRILEGKIPKPPKSFWSKLLDL
ncbi:hypothetical protein ABER75_10965 [Niallia taxi]|uniref:hypothetical protein n=1 Tax=Niallia taxi TaxID=2499688 RepID=UPI003D28F33D